MLKKHQMAILEKEQDNKINLLTLWRETGSVITLFYYFFPRKGKQEMDLENPTVRITN